MTKSIADLSKHLGTQILAFSAHIAGSSEIMAVCMCSDYAFGLSLKGSAVEVLLIIRGFQPRLQEYLRFFSGHAVALLAVDEWVFERDVDRGFLGEALAGGLIFPYFALSHSDYLHVQEVKLKKRLVLELLENLALNYPELSHDILISPEYFMYEAMLSRARLFPPIMSGPLDFLTQEGSGPEKNSVLEGYIEALKETEKEGKIAFSDNYVSISEKFIESSKSQKIRFNNLFRLAQRGLFASLLGFFPRAMSTISQNREILLRLQQLGRQDAKAVHQLEVPQRFLYIPTARGLIPFTARVNVEAFARMVLSADKDARVDIEEIGGVLNDVYLIRAVINGEEKRVIAKSFRNWSGFKWFPLTLWTVGTRTFAVSGRSRLEREFAINHFLSSRGFRVPKMLYISPNERLVFMEFIAGESLSAVVKTLGTSKRMTKTKKELRLLERVGRRFAKIHNLGIALGDTKPENVLIDEHDEIYFVDFEQAARNGDRVWDLAEFLYYSGHEFPPLADAKTAETFAAVFIKGYLDAGGSIETVHRAGTPKYTKVFSVFTLPHIMLAMANVCRNAEKAED